MNNFYSMDLEELERRRLALNQDIMDCDPEKNIAGTHIIYNKRFPLLMEMDEALRVLRKARNIILTQGVDAAGGIGK